MKNLEPDPTRIQLDSKGLNELINERKQNRKEGSTYFLDDVFAIDLSNNWTKELVRDIGRNYYLPPTVKKIYIYYLGQGSTGIKMLLGSSVWHKIETLGINDYAKHKYKKNDGLHISEYVPCLLNVLNKIDQNLWLLYFQITSDQFSEIIRASHRLTEGVSFRYSSISIDDMLDFGFEDYHFKFISLRN